MKTPVVIHKPARKHKPWTADDANQLATLVREAKKSGDVTEKQWLAIAAQVDRTVASCHVKWYEIQAGRKSTREQQKVERKRPAKEPLPPTSGSIVDQARDILRADGYGRRQIEFMHTDEIMREANRRLRAADMPQLGRKPEWLV